ncbi:MAG: hypothetical protein J1E64_03700 [Acetatifactor sp.]|nr:hypothetical protein [Acetatifactor sp.]
MQDAINLFREYMGTGLILIWFLLSLIYLWLQEKRTNPRILFVYMPVVLLLFFFNPIVARVVYRVADVEIYYRILWLLPVTMTIAYAVTEIFGKLQGKVRVLFAGLAAVILMVSGGFIYQNPFFHKAENWYHMPQSVVDICDAIVVDGREVMAAFPMELVQYVRQYDGTVCMPYGREMTVDRWNVWGELCAAMVAEEAEAATLTTLAREKGCHYIILSEDKKIVGDMAAYSYELFDRVDGYVIYRDINADLSVP